MAIRSTKSGRSILTGPDYTALRERVYRTQNGRCADCGKRKEFSEMDLHHDDRRGVGKRDDVAHKTRMLCQPCHQQRHGQRK